jgi:hypothetical protein
MRRCGSTGLSCELGFGGGSKIRRSLRAPVHGDQGFRLEGTTVSGG